MLLPVMIALIQPMAPAAPAAKALHPIISEVLYAVPKDGDADQDGVRSATGDEFIELYNPGDKAINLKGYTISNGKSAKKDAKPEGKAEGKGDAKPDGKSDKSDKGKAGGGGEKGKSDVSGHRPDESRIRFTFPELMLQPGEVVVVFNGFESHTPGAVGDAGAAAAKNEKFGGAYVFSMHCTSQYQALANAGDCVLLCDPAGNAVECVTWGSSDKKPEKEGGKVYKVACSAGSVQRTSASGEFVAHQELGGSFAGVAFSPGRFGEKK